MSVMDVSEIPPDFRGLYQIFQYSSDAVAGVAANGKLIFTNQKFRQLCSSALDEVYARLGIAESKSTLTSDLKAHLELALMGDEQEASHIFSRSSPPLEVRARYVPHFEPSGSIAAVFILFTRSTNASPEQRPTTLDERDALKHHLNAFGQPVPRHPIGLGFWYLDIKTNRLTLSKQAIDDWHQYSDMKVQTMDEAIDLIYDEDRDQVRAALAATLERGENYWTQYRMALPGMPILWIESRAEQVRDENGKLIRLAGTIHDITDQKRAETQLRESEKWFRILSDFMPEMIWTATPDGRISYANRKWIDYVGLPPHQTHELVHPTFHPEDEERVKSEWISHLASGAPFESEFRILRDSDRSFRWHLSRAAPLRDKDGLVVRWLGTTIDIDDQKQLHEKLRLATQAAEKANLIKGSFLANMSHEIRTPLTAIVGFTQLLSAEKLSEETRENYLQIIHRNSKALSLLINDILDISKFESGNYSIEKIGFRLDFLIQEILSIFSETILSKKLSVALNFADGMSKSIESDPSRLRQILVNIIGNAVKFTAIGGLTIDVSTRDTDLGRMLVIQLQDTGIGLTEEQASKLFAPFSQADHSMTRKYGGSGLGLDLSRRLAKALGGDVELSAFEIDKGCTFTISILAEASEVEITADAFPANERILRFEELPRSESAQRILLAEDAPENQFLVTEVLNQRGYRLDVAQNGAEAVTMATAEAYDLILMDMHMPVLDGFDAVTQLRERGFTKPIIALTALATDEDKEKIMAIGCDAHHPKPINFSSLIETINRLAGSLA